MYESVKNLENLPESVENLPESWTEIRKNKFCLKIHQLQSSLHIDQFISVLCLFNMEKIYSDHEVFEQIKDKSRKAYIKSWEEFKAFTTICNFEESPPGEEAIIAYFRHLRLVKKAATSTMWTTYSYINSVMKRKYGMKLQSLPRVTNHHVHQGVRGG